MILYCKAREGYKIKVGVLSKDVQTKQWVFIKHKPHLMRVIGINGGYGIQRNIVDDKGKEHDILNLFRKHPDTKVIIVDSDTGKSWFSKGKDWLEHQHKGNYGDGTQVFLSVDYMKNKDDTVLPYEQRVAHDWMNQ